MGSVLGIISGNTERHQQINYIACVCARIRFEIEVEGVINEFWYEVIFLQVRGPAANARGRGIRLERAQEDEESPLMEENVLKPIF